LFCNITEVTEFVILLVTVTSSMTQGNILHSEVESAPKIKNRHIAGASLIKTMPLSPQYPQTVMVDAK
jgi:hypothetical protein